MVGVLWFAVGVVAYVALLVLVLRILGRGARRRRGLDREAYLRRVDWVEWETQLAGAQGCPEGGSATEVRR